MNTEQPDRRCLSLWNEMGFKVPPTQTLLGFYERRVTSCWLQGFGGAPHPCSVAAKSKTFQDSRQPCG